MDPRDTTSSREWQSCPVYVNLRMPDGVVFRYVHEAHVEDVHEVCGDDALSVDVVLSVTSAEVRSLRIIGVLQAVIDPDCAADDMAYCMSLRLPHLLEQEGAGGSCEPPVAAARTILNALQQVGAGHAAAAPSTEPSEAAVLRRALHNAIAAVVQAYNMPPTDANIIPQVDRAIEFARGELEMAARAILAGEQEAGYAD